MEAKFPLNAALGLASHADIFSGARISSSSDKNVCVAGYSRINAGGGGGTPLYKPYRYVPPHRVGFLRRFGLKTGIQLAHFSQETGMVF